jgi:hypothetical protein
MINGREDRSSPYSERSPCSSDILSPANLAPTVLPVRSETNIQYFDLSHSLLMILGLLVAVHCHLADTT